MSHRIRYVMVGGFLGAGKTTTLGRLAAMYRERGQTVGIVTNDQAEGLVDTASLRGLGYEVGEVAGACFCCQFDNLVSTVRTLAESGAAPPDVILAEPVGSCTDLVATVIRPLKELFAAEFDVAPYAVILKPGHASKVLGNEGGTGFSPKAEYILRKQLEEADAVLINRIDELPGEEVENLEALVRKEIPGKPVVRISAKTGAGFEELLGALDRPGSGAVTPELDYDLYAEGEAELGWYNGAADVTAGRSVELDALLTDVLGRMKEALADRGYEAAHLKAVGVADGGFGVANLISSDGPVTLSAPSHRTVGAGGAAELIVNARVAGDPEVLKEVVNATVRAACDAADAAVTLRDERAFRPGRPVPTHRLTDDPTPTAVASTPAGAALAS
ncbi:MAG: GTP-binding protein [Planctomycetota bacterium]